MINFTVVYSDSTVAASLGFNMWSISLSNGYTNYQIYNQSKCKFPDDNPHWKNITKFVKKC